MLRDKKVFQAVFLSYTTLLLLGLSDNVRGPLFPEILHDFAVTDTQGAFFFALSSLCGFLGGLSCHRLDRRLGPLGTLRLSVLIMFLSQLAFSLAPYFSVLLVAACFFGASLGVMGVVQNVMLVQGLPRGSLKNQVLAGLHSTYAGASLLAPMIVNTVASLGWSFPIWRTSFAVTALIGAGILALTFRGPDLGLASVSSTSQAKGPEKSVHAEIYFGVILSCYVLSEILVSSRMALYTRREFSASLSESTWYTAGFFICLLASRILFTLWSPPLDLKKQLFFSLALSILSMLVGIYLHPLGLVLSGFFMGPFYPMMMVAVGHLFSQTVSRALSWPIALSSLFVVLMHLSVGYVADIWGLHAAFYLGPGFCAFALILLVVYEKVFRRLQLVF